MIRMRMMGVLHEGNAPPETEESKSISRKVKKERWTIKMNNITNNVTVQDTLTQI